MQLPGKLSLANPGIPVKKENSEDGGGSRSTEAGAGGGASRQATELSHLDEGQLGEMCVHKDGTVKLHLGKAVQLYL